MSKKSNLIAVLEEVLKSFNNHERLEPEIYNQYVRLTAVIETNYQFLNKTRYRKLVENFLVKKLPCDDFCFCFMHEYENINQEVENLLKNFNNNESRLLDLLSETYDQSFGNLLAQLYGSCDNYGLDPGSLIEDEVDLRTSAQLLLSKIR